MSKNTRPCGTPQRQPLIVAAVALGAFLIFLIQPLAARSLLPAFGGSGSVWVTALVFYQALLAAGYLLTHFIHTRLSIFRQKSALVLLSAGSLLTLSVLPQPVDTGSTLPAIQLLLSLATTVGPPFLVLAVAGPLIQGWAATQDEKASPRRNVYSLYAISNGASLLALVGYPFIMEPLLGVLQQSQLWEGLFVVEVLLLFCIMWRFEITESSFAERVKPALQIPHSERVSKRSSALLWISWSAAGVMVLTSTSAYIGQEIAAIPLLWVVPLSLYLITWIVTFSGIIQTGALTRGCLALIALILIIIAVDYQLTVDFILRLGLALTAMVLGCFAVHASLYEQRPKKEQLTRFYAAVSTGGAIGGIFAGVVAIQLFQDWRDLALAYSLVALLAGSKLLPHLLRPGKIPFHRGLSYLLVSLLSVSCLFLFVATGMDRPGLLFKHRDFHGLVRVVEKDSENPERHRLVMLHGATIHGCQFVNPTLKRLPNTYFGHGTGADIAVQAQRALVSEQKGLNIGVVGLGVGTMAAHLQKQDTMCFYELSPVVAELASNNKSLGDSKHSFSYLSDAAGEVDIVIGDARLSLASELLKQPGGNSYDLLVLDAFAGDGVPFHLLTSEAFSLYTKHLSDDGIIALHVSSNWLDLVPVVYAWADSECWKALTISTRRSADGVSGNNAVWVVLFQDQTMLPVLAAQCRPLMANGKIIVQNLRNVNYGNLLPWTDNRSDLLALMRSNIQLKDGLENRSRKNRILQSLLGFFHSWKKLPHGPCRVPPDNYF